MVPWTVTHSAIPITASLVAAGVVAVAAWFVATPRTLARGSLLVAVGGLPAYFLADGGAASPDPDARPRGLGE
jgi:uncharacterized protein involved in exopolysaccharide biosynthesis